MKRKFTMPAGDVRELDVPDFKTPYNHDRDFESERTALFCNDESLTKQEFKEDADINNIIHRILGTGQPPAMPLPEHFLDTTMQPTYFDMQSRIAEANDNFYLLPPSLRAEHLNDPSHWADAVMTAMRSNDKDKLARLGIDITKPPASSQTPTPPGGTPAPGPASGAPGAPPTAPSGAAPTPATPAAGPQN